MVDIFKEIERDKLVLRTDGEHAIRSSHRSSEETVLENTPGHPHNLTGAVQQYHSLLASQMGLCWKWITNVG